MPTVHIHLHRRKVRDVAPKRFKVRDCADCGGTCGVADQKQARAKTMEELKALKEKITTAGGKITSTSRVPAGGWEVEYSDKAFDGGFVRDGFFIATSRKQAEKMAAEVKADGGIPKIEPQSGGVFYVTWDAKHKAKDASGGELIAKLKNARSESERRDLEDQLEEMGYTKRGGYWAQEGNIERPHRGKDCGAAPNFSVNQVNVPPIPSASRTAG